MLAPGDTFLFAEEDDEKLHLNIVITQPNESGEVVTVSVMTRHRRSDAMVPLERGDHPFIERPSVIAFAYAKIVIVADIERLIQGGDAFKREPIAEKFVIRARDGCLESEDTPGDVVQFLGDLLR
jgi:hypothetical protein